MTDNRRQSYKENRVKGMTPYNAARAAGYSRKLSKKTRDVVKEEIKDAFEQAGLTDQKIIKYALEGLEATKGGKPDWGVRHRYLITILELTDRIKSSTNIDNSKHQNNIFLSSSALREARLRADAEYIPVKV